MSGDCELPATWRIFGHTSRLIPVYCDAHAALVDTGWSSPLGAA